MSEELFLMNADVTATEGGSTQETNDDTSTQDENLSQKQDNTSGGVDYKAEYESEKSRREKSEQKNVKLKRQLKDSAENSQDVEERINKLLDERLSALEVRTQQANYDVFVGQVSSSDDEAQLIKHHLEHSVRPSGDIKQDVLNAKALANRSRLAQENEALKGAIRSQATTGGGDMSSYRQAPDQTKQPSLSRKERRVLEAFGAVDDYIEDYNS